jgi:hypothetical protein
MLYSDLISCGWPWRANMGWIYGMTHSPIWSFIVWHVDEELARFWQISIVSEYQSHFKRFLQLNPVAIWKAIGGDFNWRTSVKTPTLSQGPMIKDNHCKRFCLYLHFLYHVNNFLLLFKQKYPLQNFSLFHTNYLYFISNQSLLITI